MHQERKFAIFLDIDGVFNHDSTSTIEINKVIKEQINGDRYHAFRCDGCDICSKAQAYLFDKSSVQCFEELIEKINQVAQVHIILSSSWRLGRTVEQIKQIFNMYKFSEFIIDKTTEELSSFADWKDFCVVQHFDAKNGFPLEILANGDINDSNYLNSLVHLTMRCRASQIKQWLHQHPGYICYLIIDDYDEHLSQNFNDNFISTYHDSHFLLNSSDTQKAYQYFKSCIQ